VLLDGSPTRDVRRRIAAPALLFDVEVATRDRDLLDRLQLLLGRAALRDVVVPFLDEHLRPCHERRQHEAWRSALLRR
jgi:hypothetical protein